MHKRLISGFRSSFNTIAMYNTALFKIISSNPICDLQLAFYIDGTYIVNLIIPLHIHTHTRALTCTYTRYPAIVTQDPFCWQKSEGYVKKYTFPRCREKFTFIRNISETKLGSTIIWAPEMDRMREEPAVNYITNRLSSFWWCSVYKVLRNAARGLPARSKAKKLFIFHVQRSLLRPQKKHRIFLL